MIMGAIFIAGILIIVVASRTDFFKGSLQNIPETNIHGSAESKVGTLVVDYVKVPDKNEIKIGAKEESLGKYLFKVQNEPITIEAITFEMEGNIKKENFANLKLKIAGKNVENVEFLWTNENSLLVDLSAENVELKENTDVELTGDISAGEAGQMFAFHFVDIDASGKTSSQKIGSVGVDGSVTPMPQIHILK
jgi:hypothetical protein